MKELTQEELIRLLDYYPDTGIFVWKVDRGRGVKAGTEAGTMNPNGYLSVGINGRIYLLHRLAFLGMEGYMPEYDVDHLNGITNDNRWLNLRHTTRSCNLQNQKLRSTNKSGFPGVSWNKQAKKWNSQISLNCKIIRLGLYNDVLEAALARFTFEEQCSKWTCNYRSELVKSIKAYWPEFRFG
jgi:hypothetical protein